MTNTAYYKEYGITNPAYMVMRIGGKFIEKYSAKYMTGKLIDIGCGEKKKRPLIGKYVESYTGLDHEGSLHDKTNIDMFGTAYNIPVENEYFDCVLCTAVLEHLEEPQKALYEACRILKRGGHAIYTVPLFWHLHEEPRDFYRYTKYGLRYLFEQANFEIVELKPLSGFWITFGSEFNYYISRLAHGPLRYLVKVVIAMNNIAFFALDRLDRRINKGTEKWTWAYMVVARKS
ncbi:MAG: class I SAM-dependent methyltransferase [Pirellulales bacterium]|nr:class I SAM-dependent methyltransferase [Pirellulales bacterium]